MQGWDLFFAGFMIALVAVTAVIAARRKKMKAGCRYCASAGDCTRKEQKRK